MSLISWAPNRGRLSSLSQADSAPTPGPRNEAKLSLFSFKQREGVRNNAASGRKGRAGHPRGGVPKAGMDSFRS
eukprot:9488159-Pyramimonas_sp.AAC.1